MYEPVIGEWFILNNYLPKLTHLDSTH